MHMYPVSSSRVLPVFIFLVYLISWNNKVLAQKLLTERETQIVLEAQEELRKAISDPDVTTPERLRLTERSAKTLKEYGQPFGFPSGTIPLKTMTESNYNQSRREFEDTNDFYKLLSTKLLDQQLKIVNTLQIEVASEQIKIIIPGLPAPYELSKELVSVFLKWDVAEGLNQGTYGDAKSLVARFKKLAETKELVKILENLREGQRTSMQNLYRDLQMVGPLESQLRKKYDIASYSTRTMQGYEGAQLNYGTLVNETTSGKPSEEILTAVVGNINVIDIRVQGNVLLEYSNIRIYDGDRGVLSSNDYLIGFISVGDQYFSGNYAKSSGYFGNGASILSGNLNFTSNWHAKGAFYGECCSYEAKGMVQVEGKYSNGILSVLKVKETSIRNDYLSEETVQVVYNQEKWVELVNVPLKKYPDELNKKNSTNYLYYAEIEGSEVKKMVKSLRDIVSIKSSSSSMENSHNELLPLNWNSPHGSYKLEIYLGQFKKFERNW